jgi:hypothetical protein
LFARIRESIAGWKSFHQPYRHTHTLAFNSEGDCFIMPKENPTGGSAAASSRSSITIEEVAQAVTQGVLRAVEVQHRNLGNLLLTCGGRFEFLVQFGSQAGGGLANIQELGGGTRQQLAGGGSGVGNG